MDKTIQAQEVGAQLMIFLNRKDRDEEAFINEICNGFKSLHSPFLQLMLDTASRIAELEPSSKNAAAIELAKKICDAVIL